jgi:arylsulfatase A-like enzyme
MQDVILITVDCLRAEYIYEMAQNNIFAPNLSTLLEESLYFPHAITNGPGTRFAFPALMMSKLPGELEGTGLPKETGKTLAEFFSDHGFVTLGINSNGWLSSEFNYHRGFQFFYDPLNWGKKEYQVKSRVKNFVHKWKRFYKVAKRIQEWISAVNLNYAVAYQVAKKVNDKLDEVIGSNDLMNKKKFIWLHYMDAHAPYYIHKGIIKNYSILKDINQKEAISLCRKAVTNSSVLSRLEFDILKHIYKSEISYIDYFIGQVKDNFPNAIIVITSDHGEEFGEHGRFHNPTFYNEMIRVPLLIYGLKEKGENPSLISHVDLGPYLADLLGLEPDISWNGTKDIRNIRYQYANFSDYERKGVGLFDKEHKLIVFGDDTSLVLRETDAPVDDPDKIKLLNNEINKIGKIIQEGKIEITQKDMSDQIKQQLKDLGYLQ